MKYKNINFVINEKDIRLLAGHRISTILNQRGTEIANGPTVANLNGLLTEGGSAKEILEQMRVLCEQYITIAKEIDAVAQIVVHLQDPETLPAETEVLEDLPDLEEDGLRVDRRSVQPVALASDQLKK